ncbi:MAG TPA: DUF167 domain-containing protein [Bacillota bacterium]
MSGLRVELRPEGALIDVWVQPRSRRPGVAGVREGALHLRVSAPPEDGRANDEIRRLLAGALGVRARDVRIVSGARSRAKRVLVAGCEPQRLQRLAAAGSTTGDPPGPA